MRKSKMMGVLSAIVTIVMAMQSCGKETKISHANGHSHNMGRNCMDCHNSGGEGDGVFTAAGTVYSAADTSLYKNAVVQLYTGRNMTGQLISTVYGDANGNFYTTESINFGTGLYPTVTGSTGTTYMHTMITQAACNGCHGVTQTKLIAN